MPLRPLRPAPEAASLVDSLTWVVKRRPAEQAVSKLLSLDGTVQYERYALPTRRTPQMAVEF